MNEDEPSERDVLAEEFHFRAHAKWKINAKRSSSKTEPPIYKLLAASNAYGFLFAGCESSIKVIVTSELSSGSRSSENTLSSVEIPTTNSPYLLALSSDDLILCAALITDRASLLNFYDIRTLVKGNPGFFATVNLPLIVDLKWNPGSPTILAIVLPDGSVQTMEVKDNNQVEVIAAKQMGATCVCWSPKGKQMVIGTTDGKLIQLTPQVEVKRIIASPNFSGNLPVKVTDLTWVSTFVFVVSYNTDDEESPFVFVVDAPKQAATPKFTCFEQVCYSYSDKHRQRYSMILIDSWDLTVMISSNSPEVGLIAKQLKDKSLWEKWTLSDSGCAECPLTPNSDETFPLGLALDRTSQTAIQLSADRSIPPCPILFLLSDAGDLLSYNAVSHKPSDSMCRPAVVPSGERRALALPRAIVELPRTTTGVGSVASQQGPLAAEGGSRLETPVIGKQTQSGDLPREPVPIDTKRQPDVTTSLLLQSTTNSSTYRAEAASEMSPISASKVNVKSNLDFLTKPAASGIKPGILLGNKLTLVQESTGAPLDQRQSIGLRSAEPVAKPLSVPSSGTSSVLSGKTALLAPPDTSPMLPLRQTGLTPALPLAQSTPKPPLSGSATVPDAMPKSPRLIAKAKPISRAAKLVVGKSVADLVNSFQLELDAHLSTATSGFDSGFIDKERSKSLRHSVNEVDEFTNEINRTLKELSADMSMLKRKLLHGFALYEECRCLIDRNEDPNFVHLLKSCPLNPETALKMEEIRREWFYVDSTMSNLVQVLTDRRREALHAPTLDAIYKTMSLHNQMIAERSSILDSLISSTGSLNLGGRSILHPKANALNKSSRALDQQPMLAKGQAVTYSDKNWISSYRRDYESTAMKRNFDAHETSLDELIKRITIEPTTKVKNIPDQKQSRIRSLLSQRNKTPVRRASSGKLVAESNRSRYRAPSLTYTVSPGKGDSPLKAERDIVAPCLLASVQTPEVDDSRKTVQIAPIDTSTISRPFDKPLNDVSTSLGQSKAQIPFQSVSLFSQHTVTHGNPPEGSKPRGLLSPSDIAKRAEEVAKRQTYTPTSCPVVNVKLLPKETRNLNLATESAPVELVVNVAKNRGSGDVVGRNEVPASHPKLFHSVHAAPIPVSKLSVESTATSSKRDADLVVPPVDRSRTSQLPTPSKSEPAVTLTSNHSTPFVFPKFDFAQSPPQSSTSLQSSQKFSFSQSTSSIPSNRPFSFSLPSAPKATLPDSKSGLWGSNKDPAAAVDALAKQPLDACKNQTLAAESTSASCSDSDEIKDTLANVKSGMTAAESLTDSRSSGLLSTNTNILKTNLKPNLGPPDVLTVQSSSSTSAPSKSGIAQSRLPCPSSAVKGDTNTEVVDDKVSSSRSVTSKVVPLCATLGQTEPATEGSVSSDVSTKSSMANQRLSPNHGLGQPSSAYSISGLQMSSGPVSNQDTTSVVAQPPPSIIGHPTQSSKVSIAASIQSSSTTTPLPITTFISSSSVIVTSPSSVFGISTSNASSITPLASTVTSSGQVSSASIFGAPVSTDTSTGQVSSSSIFGTPVSTVTSAGQVSSSSIFGAPASTVTSAGQVSSSSIFGAPASTVTSAGQVSSASIFGAPASTVTSAGQVSSASIFGAPAYTVTSAGQVSSASIFGAPASTVTSAGQVSSASIFGAPASTATSSTFGQPTSGTSIFGQPTSTNSVFGQPAPTGSIFGQATSTASVFAQPSSFLTSSTSGSALGQPNQSSSLFGNKNTAQLSPFTSNKSVFGDFPATEGFGGSSNIFSSQAQGAFSDQTRTGQAGIFESALSSLGGKSAGAANHNPFAVTKPAAIAGSDPFSGTPGGAFSSRPSSFGQSASEAPPVQGMFTGGKGVNMAGFGASHPPTFGVVPGSGSVFGEQPTFGGGASFSSPPSFNTNPGSVFGSGSKESFGFSQNTQSNVPTFGSLMQGLGDDAQPAPATFGQSTTSSFSSWR